MDKPTQVTGLQCVDCYTRTSEEEASSRKFNTDKCAKCGGALEEIIVELKGLPIRIAGVTKDGVYAAEKNILLQASGDTAFTVPKVITENGYQNITVRVNDQGVLQGIQLERWDPTS